MEPALGGDDILERLRRLVPDRVPVDPAALTPGASLAAIGIDSFSLIELVFLAEEEFGIHIPVDQLEVDTVADVVAAIQRAAASSA